MARTFKLKRGLKKDLPILAEGEPAFTLDEKKLYIGTGQENVVVGSQTELTDHISNKGNPHGVTAAQVQAIPTSQKGAAGGVAELGSDGKVPSGQLPALNYDPAGSAAGVQNNLNTHAGDTNLHVNATKQTAWNNAATAANNAYNQANAAYNIASASNLTALNPVIIGTNTKTASSNSIAIGTNTVTNGINAIALGRLANSGANSIAVGNNAIANSTMSTAIGFGAYANQTNSISIGRNSSATGVNSIAIGSNANCTMANGVAIGSLSMTVNNNNANVLGGTAVGHLAKAWGDKSVAIGANTLSSGNLATAVGYYAIAEGFGSIAIGQYSDTSNGPNNTAIGSNATADSLQGFCVAVGAMACAMANYATALGPEALSTYQYSTALGFNAAVTAANSIRLGSTNSSEYSGLYSIRNISASSDQRDKADIEPITNAMDFLNSLQAIQYVDNARTAYMPEELTEEQHKLREKYTMHRDLYDVNAHAKGGKKGERKRVGVLAQEVQEKMLEIYGTDNYAELVHDNLYDRKQEGEDFPDGVEELLSVNYTSFIPFLIKAIQELSGELKQVKTKAEEAKAEIRELKEKLNV